MNKLIKPDFVTGNEKRFFDFVSKLNEDEVTVIISHNDCDGISAAKVANEVINADYIKFLGYPDLYNGLVEKLKELEAKYVIFTDMLITKPEFVKEIEKFAEVLIIDHHIFDSDFNSDRTVFMNAQGFCATYLCYYLFGRFQNIDYYDWLVAVASVTDWLYNENRSWLNSIYKRYGDELKLDSNGFVVKQGKIWDICECISLSLIYFDDDKRKVFDLIGKDISSLNHLKKYSKIILEEADRIVNDFYKDKKEFGEIYFYEVKSKYSVNSLISTILSTKILDHSIILLNIKEDICKISARRQDGNVNLPNLLKKMTEGFEECNVGGHFKAAGGHFPKSYLDEFLKRLGKMY